MSKPIVLLSHKKKLIYDSLNNFLDSNMDVTLLSDTDSILSGDMQESVTPSIIITELESFDLSIVCHFTSRYPAAGVIGIFELVRPLLVKQFFRLGGKGIMTLDSSLSELVPCMNEVAVGKRFTSAVINDVLLVDALDETNIDEEVVDTLTRREMDILRFVSEGKSSKEIGLKLLISYRTVEVHRYKLLKKLKLKNTAELVNFSYPLFHGNSPEHLLNSATAKIDYFSGLRLDETA